MLELQKFVRNIPDFPKTGVLYKDISPLLQNPEAMAFAVQLFMKKLYQLNIHKVVGIESRGFFFATLLAEKLKAGFVPVRKPGKLPYKTYTEEYALEYGTDALQVHRDSIERGENVLVHDDVLATGGTALAACNLVEKLGGNIVQCNFLVELAYLKGKDRLENYQVETLLKY